MIFTHGISTSGGLHSHFCFTSEEARKEWKRKKIRELSEKYGNVRFEEHPLRGLHVGDRCNVWGEGTDEFKIKRVVKYSDDRYGFVLDNGVCEEVHKCHTSYLKTN